MSININMNKEQYESFMRCIQVFNKKSSDVSIVNGKVYQFNDGKRYLYDIDLTDIFGENTLYLSNFDSKYNLLDIFKKQCSAVDLEITDRKYVFSDKYSSIEFQVPDPRSMINKPVSEGSAATNRYTAVNSKNIIMQCTLEPFILERIVQAQKTLDTDKISVVCNSGEAHLVMTMGDNNNRAQIIKILETESDENYDGAAIFPIDAFQLNTESMDVTLYGHDEEEDSVILKIDTKLGIDPCLDVKMASVQTFIKRKKQPSG